MGSLQYSPLASLAFAGAVFFAIVLVCQWMTTFKAVAGRLNKADERFGGVDGLRGLLAVGVYVHHCFTAHAYFTAGVWDYSESALFNQLGQTGVALFFMITGFLFTRRITSGRPLSWAGRACPEFCVRGIT